MNYQLDLFINKFRLEQNIKRALELELKKLNEELTI